MSYQKSVALLSCAFLFSALAPESTKAFTSEAPKWESHEVVERSLTPGLNAEFFLTHPKSNAVSPPDTEGPVITATAPADVTLYGCHDDLTFSEGAMGKPTYSVYDDCGSAAVTKTYSDSFAYCAQADDATPEGGLVITRTFTIVAEDCYENTTTVTLVQTITVVDNNLPSFVEALPGDTTVDCASVPSAPVLTATDTCDSDVSVSYTELATNDCSGITRTWVAVDDCGNSITHTQNITVTDTTDPVITGTPSDIALNNDAENCGAQVTWTAPTATDNCALKSLESDHDSGDTFPVGTTLVTYTATDSCGNTATTSFNVVITDAEDPVLVGVPSDIAQGNDLDSCGAIVTWTLPTSSDNCSGDTLVGSHAPGDYFALGQTTVTYTATDSVGNDTTSTFVVTISDEQKPAIDGLPSDISVLAGADSCGTVVNWTAPTSSDNCSVTSFAPSSPSGSVFAVGTHTISYTASDAAGNDSIASFDIVVADAENPVISDMPEDITITAEADSCSAVVTWQGATADDNCDMQSLTSDYSSGDRFPVGATLVTYTALDIHGNDTTATFTITVTDDQSPSLIGMPSDITQTMDQDSCGAVVSWTPPTVDENCSQTLTASHNPGDYFPAGPTTVTYISMDPSGGGDTASFTITTTDDEAPVILNTPTDFGVDSDAGVCTAVATWTPPTASDNCGQTMTSTHNPGDTFESGETVVSYVSVDAAGNQDSTAFTITVSDNEAPVLTAMAMDTTSECSGLTDTTDLDAWLANHGGATATDNCDSLAWTHNYAGDCTVEVGDFNTHQQGGWGSTSGGVHDNLNNNFDAIFPSGVTVGCSAGYEIVFTTADAIETYLPCTGDAESLVISHSGPNPEASSDPTCWNNALVSQILTAKLNAQFDANLPAFSSSDLLLGDLVATSGVFMGMSANDIIAVADSIVGDCSTSYTLNEIRAVLNDFNRNYAGSQVDEGLFAPAACFYGDCGGTGSVTVTFTATDEAGNTSSTTASFTSVDTTPPTISAQDYTLALDSTGAATLTAANVDTGTADACGFDTLTLSQTAFDCSHLGDVTVTLTALDDCGNSSTADVTITVTDTIAPNITEADVADITQDSDADVCTAVVTWTDPSTWDNCAGETLSYSHASGSTFDVGVTTVTITVTDGSANADSLTFDVTIEDNQVPTIAAMAQVDAETSPTTCDALVTWTDPVTSDNCPGDTLTYSHDPGSTFGLGTTTVTAYVTDAAMNTDSVKFDVVVVDATDPVINGMPTDTTISNDLDACEAVYNWTAPSAADNCELDTLYADHDSGDSFPLGATVVTYTALDETGNDSLATFTITVEDNQAPTIASLPDTTLSSELSSCSAVYTWLNPATSDNCPGETISSSHPSGSAFPVGSTTVTLTVTDASLNSDSTSFVVTVLDNENPIIATMSDITVNTAPGLCTQTVPWTAPAVTDNCALDTLTCSHTPGSSFTAAGSGETTITYTALDSSGNTATETFKIIVVDNELPVMTAASDTTLECAENNGAAFSAWLANYGGATATDNCTGNLTWTNDHDDNEEPNWICGYTTSITVTFTATDESSNSSTTTATFNVVDTTDPVFDQTLPGDTTVNCESVPAAVALTAQDGCSGEISVTYVPDTVPGACPHEYTINRTWSTTDDCGNSATHTQVITVQDTVAPLITVQAMDSTLACDGTDHSADFASWRAAYGGATATETCGDITWTESYVMGSTCAGDSAEVTFTATDECGNFSTTTAIWKMEDVTAPVLVTPAENDTVECDGAGNTAAIVAWLSANAGATATEECSGLKWSNDFSTMGMTCGNTSAVQVVFTATDSCQNATQTVATFVIEDTTPPSFVEALPANGTFECDAVPTPETLTATDICGGSMPVTFNQQRVDSICPDTYRLMRTWTTADSCGNTASHTQTLIIEDTSAPLVVAKDFTIYLDDNGSATLVADSLDNGSSDNCSTPFFSADNTTFNCGNLGGNPVLLTASDSCLNTASATVQVTVLDTISPVFVDEFGSPALAEDKTVECDGTDHTTDLNSWIANHGGAEAEDNCSSFVWSTSDTTFVPSCGNSGSYTMTFTATDPSGNSSSTTASYIISDTEPPVIASSATNVTVECDGNGNTEALASWVEANGGAGAVSDACGDVTWSNNFSGFGASCTGSSAVEVTFYATDDCGNVASTSSIFTIEDTTAPELTTAAADTTVECDGAGNTAALSAWLSNNGGAIADEICGDVTWSFSPGDLGGTPEFVYAMGHEDWGDDGSENGYPSFYRYDYNADGSISNPQLMFRLDEFDEDLIASYYFSGYDRNPVTGTDYFVVGDGPRALLTYDIESDVVTDTGIEWDGDQSYGPDAFAFSNDGTCYAWINYSNSPSEIQTVNLSTGAMETFITVNQGGGAKALTYDFDNNRLLLASRGNGGASHKLGAVDLATGDYTLLHNIAAEPSNTEDDDYTTIMGLEYIGNGMCLVSGGWRGHDFGQLDVAAGTINYTVDDTYLVNPDQPALKRLFVPISAGLPALSDACAESGDLEVTFTAKDGCGNTVVSTAMFIVTDTTSPTALAQDVTVYLDANGLASITTADVDNGSSDDCGDVTMALDVTSFDCDDVGPNPVVLTVWDACMNADSATITVNVTALDSLAPTVENMPADTTVTADDSKCSAIVNFVMPTAADNCDGGSLTASHNPGDEFPVGTTTVTFTVVDASQNTDSTTFDITVTDDELPAFAQVPSNISVNSDTGVCTAAPPWTAPVITDNCGIDTIISTHESGDVFSLGTTTVTYTATDIHGNVDSVSFTVEVTDAEKPAIAGLPADIAQGNDVGECTAAVTWTLPTASDNCELDTLISSHQSGDVFPLGATVVTYTATDAAGNDSIATFTVTISDTEKPGIENLPSNITQTNDEDVCGAVITWEGYDSTTDSYINVEESDNCPGANISSTHNSGDTFPVGVTTVTYTAIDAAGNDSIASFTVTITDDQKPAIDGLPADFSQTADADSCGAMVSWTPPTSSDNCTGDTLATSHEVGSYFPVGTTTVTYTATDSVGNDSIASFVITVTDDQAPAILGLPGDLSASNDLDSCGAVMTWSAPSAADNCTVDTLYSSHASGDYFPVGVTTVTYTAVDIYSNSTDSTFTVTVTDDQDPAITAASDTTVECNGSGNTDELNAWLANHGGATATDNCDAVTITNDYNTAVMADSCGMTGTVLVTFTATDGSGNTSTTNATFIIQDTTPPTFEPNGASEVVECDGSGNADELTAWLDIWNNGITVTDNCGGVSVSKTSTLLTDECGATGEASVTFVATDACGNQTDTTLTFTIEDTTPPTLLTTAQDSTVECDGAGNQDAFDAWLASHGGATAEDVCGNYTWSNNFIALSDDCGATGSATVTFSATDECGNTSTTTATFTIEDTTDPAIASEAIDLTVECDGAGNLSDLNGWLSANGNAGAASDVCGTYTWSNDFVALSDDCGFTGSSTVIFTVTDECSNTSTTSAIFTIEDTTVPDVPVLTCPKDTILYADANCFVDTTTSSIGYATATAFDACDSLPTINFSYVDAPAVYTCTADADNAAEGSYGFTRTWTSTVTDECGLTSAAATCVQTITVLDTVSPILVAAMDTTVECDGAGNPADLAAWLANNGGSTGTDNCDSELAWTNDYDPANFVDLCGATGYVVVTFTAKDDCGNSSSTTATFTIEDTMPPVFSATAEDLTVECDGAGNTTELNNWLAANANAAASDVCGGVTWSHDFIALSDDCGETGMSTVTFTVTDDCGNSVYTSAQFTIEDTTAPSMDVESADLTVECDGAGNLSELNGWIASNGGASASDDCSSVTWSNDFEGLSDDCGATGAATVTFTATDDCGLSTSTTATFTIEDTTAPSIDIASADLTVECDGAGNTTELNNWLNSHGGASASDLCSDPVITPVAMNVSSLIDAGPNATWPHVVTLTTSADPSSANQQSLEINVTFLPSGGANFRAVKTVADGSWFQSSIQPLVLGVNTITVSGAAFQRDVQVQFSDGEVEFDSLVINGEEQMSAPPSTGITWSNDFTALSDDCGATGSATVTFTATDACGNTSSTTSAFTIEDTTAPSMDVASSDLTVECDGNGNPTELNAWLTSNGGASASDVCSGVNWSNNFAGLSDLCSATGGATVTFTAADDCGISTSTTATFTIVDTTNPVVSGDEVVIIDCSQWPWETLYEPTIDELLAIQDTAGNPIITLIEECGYSDFPIDYTWMSGGCHYDHQLVYRPIDDCGNAGDTLYQLIQVDDFSDPVFTFVPADTSIACTENVMAYLEMATAVDACDPSVNMTFTDSISTEIPGGYVIHREFRAEDCGYNVALMTQLITVTDTVAPVLTVTAPADVTLNGCLASADTTEATNGSPVFTTSDNCNEVTVTYTVSDALDFTCSGTADDASGEGSFIVTRTFTVTALDAAANATTTSVVQTFTITDDTDPTVSLTAPADTTVYLDATCFAAEVVHPVSGDASGFIVEATDLCDTDVAHTITHTDDTTYTGAVDGVGSYSILRTYTVMVMDDCGNSSSASTSHTIAVLDTINPSITPDFPNDTIIYADDSNGYFDPTPSSTGGPSVDYSDNCSGSGESQYGAIGQSVPTGGLIITAIGDPNDAASTCRFVEIHNSSDADIDMSGYALQRWTNGSATPSTSNNVDLSPLGTLEPGEYAHISNSAGFEGCYGFASSLVGGGSGPVGSNGDDNIAIINSSSDIIDLFGVIGEDGSNTCHDFEDGVALRAGTNTDPNGGAWDEAGWIVYSDFSNASGCTNHNSSQQQNAADIAPLLNNWAGAGEAPVETDFNDADISFSDETISYTASACYTFERTWTVTVTDNNGNATTASAVQTIAVSDTTAPVITADAETTAACDFFGFDLSAGDESTLLAGTSFEQASTGSQYTDTGDASEDHALVNNPGQADVNFTAANGEMGFTSYFYTTGSGGLSNDFTGVSSFTGTVDAFTDGAQGFQMTDVDGRMELTFDEVDVSDGGVALSIDAFVQSTGWEAADLVRIWVVADGGEVDLLNTTGQDIDNLGIEDQWITYTLDLDGYDSAELHVSLASNSGSETLYIDNISFSQGNSPMAALLANGYVSFSDNVELATTGASITLDGSPCEGAYDIVYSATDSCGNASSMSQRIELVDTVDPVLLVAEPADTVIYADADCYADYIDGVPYPAASATDNCDEDVEITAYHVDSPKQYACLPGTGAFTLQRTYTTTATDNCGNEHTVQVNRLVTVLDTISPTFNVSAPAALSVNIDPFCGANTSTTIGGEPTITDAADNCDSDVAIEITHVDSTPVYTCSDADGQAEGTYTFVRTFTVTASDDCGNQTVKTVTQDVTATDVTSPVITAVPPMAEEVINLDADCFADLSPTAMPLASASDACDTDVSITSTYVDGAPTYTCSDADGEAEGSFTFTRTWTVTATDDCNNSNSQQTTQTVTVLDGLAPTLTPTWPEDYTTDLDENCDADLSASMTGMATATSEDACDSEVSVSISHADHDTTLLAVNVDALAEGGFTFIRTWTVVGMDDCGNQTTATHDQVITANDVLAPSQTLETLPTYTVEGCYGDVDLSPATTGTPMVTAEDACDSELDIDLTYSADDLAFNEVMGDYSLIIDTISGPEEGIIGSTTVRIYIETENEGDFISAVAGDIVNPTGIRTTTSFYQNALGSNTANSLSDLLVAADPMLAYDSWVTIGIEEAPNSGDGEVETSTIGDWAAAFAAGEDLLISDFFGGSWYTIFPNSAAVAGDDHRVLLGQFTTDGQMSGQLFVQVFPNGVGADEQRMSFTFGDCAEDDDTPEGSYSFTRRWESVVTDDANNQDTAVSYQHIMVLDTEAPQLTNTCDIENGETVAYDCPGEGVLDFDPVPVACNVTAIDNCDSEVNVNLFTETTGYIPTNDIRNYCAPMTPEAQSGNQTCDDRAPESMRLFNFPGLDDSFVMADGESLVQVKSDGSLEISMEMENGDGTGGFIMTASYGVGQDWTTWQASGSNYKKDCAEIYPGEAVWEDWVYFLMTEGSLEGTGMYAGSSFSLSHQPANGYYGLQMGLGANNKNSNYGGSAWFFWQGNLFMDGTDMGPMASSGDFYMDLDCCLEWQVDYFYTALDDCGNPTGFSYSEAMGTDLNGGGADVSGGHTGGPVDITNVGGIKEPIRITGLAPNPTDNQSQLTFLVNQNMRLRVDLYTMEGLLVQELYEGNAVTGVQYMMDIDADQLAAGMYQVRVSSNVYLAVKKLLVAD